MEEREEKNNSQNHKNIKSKSSLKSRLEKMIKSRASIQVFSCLVANPHLSNFLTGRLYTGKLKMTCLPGLNCYSCPAATGACPIGAFQAVVGSSKFSFSYYISGILILIATIFGRLICGFVCPFGFFQDLIHKLPVKKFSTRGLRLLRYLKYLILFVVVALLPVLLTNNLDMGPPYFCKYICPQGLLEGGIPLSLASSGIRAALGSLFALKSFILLAVIILSSVFYRPFCKWICPLGAFYALFNRLAILGLSLDKGACINCGACRRVCKMDVDVTKDENSPECIRCGDCIGACPTRAITRSRKLL